MAKTVTEIIRQLPRFRKTAESLRETLIANLIMIGQIPAPTFHEEKKLGMLQQRFSECGLQNCSSDEKGNGLGILPGQDSEEREGSERNILVVAHADTVFPESVDHNVTVRPDCVIGPGVGDNSLGLAVLATLPTLSEALELRFKANLIMMGASRSLGRGDLEGLRFFLANNAMPIHAGVCVEGFQLGRLGLASIGMLRGEITCTVPEEYDWTQFGASGAIVTLNEVIDHIIQIRLPKRPRTTIVLGSVQGGASFNTIATHAVLRFEIRSESAEMVGELRRQMRNIVAEVSSKAGAQVSLDIFARRNPGGIAFMHPLARCTRSILRGLKIQPRISPSTSELSAFIDREIPAITLGITIGENLNELDEKVQIRPMAAGIAQLLGVLLAIDGGFCDED